MKTKIVLFRNGDIYTPESIGRKDILVMNGEIVKIDNNIDISELKLDYDEFDATCYKILPGIIDQHVHIIGGGGEAGFASRIPEVKLSTLIAGGVTTVLGLLGTDGTTRDLKTLLAKSRSLKAHGITSYILTGSYEIPTQTVTGSVKSDIILLDHVIGVKIAMCDHRASYVTVNDLAKIASDARTAGMIGNKAGIVTIHTGYGKEKLDVLFETLEKTNIPIKHFIPTHVNRNQDILMDAVKFAKMGGFIDLTAVPSKDYLHDLTAGEAIRESLTCGVPLEHITISSDGNGSWSKYDKKGHLIHIGTSNPNNLYGEIKHMVIEMGFSITDAFKPVTSNVADVLHLNNHKGKIKEGYDADLLVLDNDMNIDSLMAMGHFLKRHKKHLKWEMFE